MARQSVDAILGENLDMTTIIILERKVNANIEIED